MRSWLLDTGPLVSYLDAADPFHSAVAEVLDNFTGRLHTTSAVVTEAMHFAAASPEGPSILSEFVRLSELEIHSFMRNDQLTSAAALMKKYSDVPMDFADATLILLAEQLDIADILTLDRRGFTVFRFHRNVPFRLVLDSA